MLTETGKIAIAVGLVGLGAIALVVKEATKEEPTRVEKTFDGGAPKDSTCITATVLLDTQTLAKDGLNAEQETYGQMTVCGAKPTFPEGVKVLSVTETKYAYDGGAAYKVALAGEAEFPCACSTGKDCEMVGDGGWVPAVRGNTLAAGKWRGAGCYRKSCIEGFGWRTSWPGKCPQ